MVLLVGDMKQVSLAASGKAEGYIAGYSDCLRVLCPDACQERGSPCREESGRSVVVVVVAVRHRRRRRKER